MFVQVCPASSGQHDVKLTSRKLQIEERTAPKRPPSSQLAPKPFQQRHRDCGCKCQPRSTFKRVFRRTVTVERVLETEEGGEEGMLRVEDQRGDKSLELSKGGRMLVASGS